MLEPLNSNVILEKVKEENVTSNGIVLSNNKEKPSIGLVIEVGNEVKQIQKNDKVVYKKYSGTEFTYENKEYLIVDQKEILAIIR